MGFFSNVGHALSGVGKVAKVVFPVAYLANIGLKTAVQKGAKAANGGDAPPPYDPTIQPQIDEINSNRDAENKILQSSYDRGQALNSPYLAGVRDSGDEYAKQSRVNSQQFLNDVGSAGDKLGQNLSDALLQRTMYSQPAIQNQLREQLAASGGIQRGGYDQAVLQNAAQTSNQLAQGNQDIINQQLAARQGALGDAYSANQGILSQRLGNDVSAQGAIYGNAVTSSNALGTGQLGTQQNASNNTLGALGYKESANLAQNQAAIQNAAALNGAFIGAAGTIGGAIVGGPVGAAAGGTLASALTNRGTVTQTPSGNSLNQGLRQPAGVMRYPGLQ